MSIGIKICGIKTKEGLQACVAQAVDYVGFVHYKASPRHIEAKDAAQLAVLLSDQQQSVTLFVDPKEAEIASYLEDFTPDMIQLHGHESPEMVATIKERFGLPIIKAVNICEGDDIARAQPYVNVADILLFDSKAPKNGLPGGNGLMFDWKLLEGRQFDFRWMLSGGLNADNVAQAIDITAAPMVDVSSSVEQIAGIKDPTLIESFVTKVRSLDR